MPKTTIDKLDCAVRVITPENIEFEYALAGPFQRLPAFVFDVVIRIIVFMTFMFLLALFFAWLSLGIFVVLVAGFLSFFFFSWFYGIYFETRFNGRTLGKMLFRLRVISVDGRPINGVQAALRNLLRPADMAVLMSLQIFGPEVQAVHAIPTMFIGLAVMTLTGRLQRLGDLAAGTMVISEHRKRSPWNLQPEDLRAFGLAELIPATFSVSSSLAQTTGLYMENRKRLSPPRRIEVAKHVATPLIKRFDLLPDTSADLLLCALYVRIFLSDEQQKQGRDKLRQIPVPGPRVPPPVRSAFVTPKLSPESAAKPEEAKPALAARPSIPAQGNPAPGIPAPGDSAVASESQVSPLDNPQESDDSNDG